MHAKFFLYKILKPPRREKVAAVQFTIQFTQYAIQNPYGGVVHGTRPYLAKRASDTCGYPASVILLLREVHLGSQTLWAHLRVLILFFKNTHQ